jgi:hypothetical protein
METCLIKYFLVYAQIYKARAEGIHIEERDDLFMRDNFTEYNS